MKHDFFTPMQKHKMQMFVNKGQANYFLRKEMNQFMEEKIVQYNEKFMIQMCCLVIFRVME
jgi:hypothetical protein